MGEASFGFRCTGFSDCGRCVINNRDELDDFCKSEAIPLTPLPAQGYSLRGSAASRRRSSHEMDNEYGWECRHRTLGRVRGQSLGVLLMAALAHYSTLSSGRLQNAGRGGHGNA